MDLYLIDGNSYFHRAFHAIKDLSNSKGAPTNAVYGFTTMILKILREKKPDAFAIVFDSPVPTQRHRLYEDYKAQRPETPGELLVQIPVIKDVIKAFNIPVFEMPGYEADDVICTIAKKAVSQGGQRVSVFIVSGDKDMMQAVTGSVRIYDPMKDTVIDEAYVKDRFGMPPERIYEVMALTGDVIDNVPGIKGIGEKTAKNLLLAAGGLDSLLEHPEKIENVRIRKLVMENADIVRLGRTLVAIDADVPVQVDLNQLAMREPDWPALLHLFTELEFRSLIKLVPSEGHAPRGEYLIIDSGEQLRKFLGFGA